MKTLSLAGLLLLGACATADDSGLGRKPAGTPAGLHLLVSTLGGFSAEPVLTVTAPSSVEAGPSNVMSPAAVVMFTPLTTARSS